jgi:hypothetical protein
VRVIGDPDNLLGSPPTGAAVAPGPIMVSAELAGHAVAEVIDEAVNRSRVQQAAYERRLRRLERKLHKAEKAAARARARAQRKAGGRPAAKAKRATGPSVDQLTARQLVGVLRRRAVRRLTRR